jgi:uncharacterized LabA/DUF88 family protein
LTTHPPRAAIYIDLRYIEIVLHGWSTALRESQPNTNRIRVDYWTLTDFLSQGLGRPPVHYYDAMPAEAKTEPFLHNFLRRSPRNHLHVRRSMEGPDWEQKEVDVHMAVDIVRDAMAASVQRQILITGDRDFIPAIEASRACGVHVTLASFQDYSGTPKLRAACDAAINLDDIPVMTLLPPKAEVPQ